MLNFILFYKLYSSLDSKTRALRARKQHVTIGYALSACHRETHVSAVNHVDKSRYTLSNLDVGSCLQIRMGVCVCACLPCKQDCCESEGLGAQGGAGN